MSVADISVSTLREAARAWRRSDIIAAQHRDASGWFRWLVPAPNLSVHDRIDDLITEIERLRGGGNGPEAAAAIAQCRGSAARRRIR
jgi:hypothetical protein